MDWCEWHEGYQQSMALQQRLAKVREHIVEALDHADPGPIRILSICAGDGRDVISALRDHPRRHEVVARLLELDPRLVASGRELARDAQLERNVQFDVVDATRSESYDGCIPCQLMLACGVLGNIPIQSSEFIVALASAACATGGRLVWTRLVAANNGTTHVPILQRLLTSAGFEQLRWDVQGDDDEAGGRYIETFGAGRAVVASFVQRGMPGPMPVGELFRFVGFPTLMKERESPAPADSSS